MGNNLDDELAKIAAADDAVADEASMAVPQPGRDEDAFYDAGDGPKKGNGGLLVMLLCMVGGIVALVMFGFKEAAVYSVPVGKLLAQGDKKIDRRVRIEGELVPGTLVKREQPCEFRFRIRDEKSEIAVRYPKCAVPDSFRDVPEGGVEVTAEGMLTKEGHFEAATIMAKCSSKYDPTTHTLAGEKAPAGPVAYP